jgi:uncharacterized protein
MSKVFFYNIKKHSHTSPLDKLSELIKRLKVTTEVSSKESCALKMHFGEPGNTSFVRPVFISQIVKNLKASDLNVFLTDTNTLYYGHRSDAISHINAAIGNGFAYAVTNAPIIIADGLTGKEYVNVEINKKHFTEVKIGSAIHNSDSMVVVSHFKGHELTGFGGAIKNASMGCSSRSGKQMMHSSIKPSIYHEQCSACSDCIEYCPKNAIEIKEIKAKSRAFIDHDLCYGCGECVVTCKQKAIKINWKTDVNIMQEKMAEFALGAIQNKKNKTYYINFLYDISPNCDCYGFNDTPIAQNIGIMASKDPVALDKACYDAVGEKVFQSIYPEIDSLVQLRYAEELGIGKQKYNLVEI